MIAAYLKTVWVNDSAPDLDQTNLDKIEQGVKDAVDELRRLAGNPAAPNTAIALDALIRAGSYTFVGQSSQYVAANNWMMSYFSSNIYWDGTNWISPGGTHGNGWSAFGFHEDGSTVIYGDVSTGTLARTYTSAQFLAKSISVVGDVGIPSGAMMEYGGAVAPAGWLLCDGSAVSRTSFASLFGSLGINYGAGDGLTTFNLPDFRGRVAVGYAVSGGHADVDTLGKNDGVAVASRRPKHRHTPHKHVLSALLSHSIAYAASGGAGAVYDSLTSPDTDLADGGSGNAADSLDAPAYVVVNKIVKT